MDAEPLEKLVVRQRRAAALYFLLDHFVYYRRETIPDVVRDETQVRGLKFGGLWPNGLLLVGIIVSVALLDPAKPFPGTDWHPWILFARDGAVGAGGYFAASLDRTRCATTTTSTTWPSSRSAALFIGIFVAMQPALEILNAHGASLGIDSPMKFFWATGWLSAVLDNAPTYLVFFKTAETLPAEGAVQVAGIAEPLLAPSRWGRC